MKKLIFLILGIILLSGCIAEFEDVSAKYPDVINSEYKAIGKLFIYGYTLKVEKNNKLNGYSLHEPPGVGGPEILSKSKLPIGSKFTIYKVEKCSNCFPFPAYTRFLIKFKNSKFSAVPIHFGEHIFRKKGELWH